MPYTARHQLSLGFVEVTFHGSATPADLGAATTHCISLQKQTGVDRFLVDTDSLDLSLEAADVVELPATQYWKEELSRLSRIAVILPASAHAKESVRLYEIACQNRGWNARVFPDRQSALEWLSDAKGANR